MSVQIIFIPIGLIVLGLLIYMIFLFPKNQKEQIKPRNPTLVYTRF